METAYRQRSSGVLIDQGCCRILPSPRPSGGRYAVFTSATAQGGDIQHPPQVGRLLVSPAFRRKHVTKLKIEPFAAQEYTAAKSRGFLSIQRLRFEVKPWNPVNAVRLDNPVPADRLRHLRQASQLVQEAASSSTCGVSMLAQVFCQGFVSSLNVDHEPTTQSLNQTMLVGNRTGCEATLQVFHLA